MASPLNMTLIPCTETLFKKYYYLMLCNLLDVTEITTTNIFIFLIFSPNLNKIEIPTKPGPRNLLNLKKTTD